MYKKCHRGGGGAKESQRISWIWKKGKTTASKSSGFDKCMALAKRDPAICSQNSLYLSFSLAPAFSSMCYKETSPIISFPFSSTR
jgi:hypothetical protein